MHIVCYHNVLDEPLDPFDRAAPRLTIASFTRQMEYLAQYFKVLPLPEALRLWSSGEPTAQVAVVTFDDAYYGVYQHARPILRGLGLPAAVFAVTAYVDRGGTTAFEHDETEIAFRIAPAARIDLDFLGLSAYSLDSDVARIGALKAAKRELKVTPAQHLAAARASLFERLAVTPEQCQQYARTRPAFRQMGWSELRELHSEGWEVGSHTRTHKALGQTESPLLEEEVNGSANDLRAHLGLAAPTFAYPYGEMSHIGEAAPAAVRNAGYSCALTMVPGLNDNSTDRFLLHRLEFARLVYNMTFAGPNSPP